MHNEAAVWSISVYGGERRVFDKMREHEQVVFCNDPLTGLQGIIAIHNTTFGPAMGGCRMRPYASVDEALEDALRLSKGMTYKCAAADVSFGGGKAVLIGDPHKDRSPDVFRAFGQFVESLGGRFYTGTDMGTTPEDFVHASKETSFIVGLPEVYGGSGDSSIPTARGVVYGIQATNAVVWGDEQLAGRTYAVQGLGKVGWKVAEQLLAEGADVYVTDVDETKMAQMAAHSETLPGTLRTVPERDIYGARADVFVPCAVGGVINDDTLDALKVKAIVGSANNQLLTRAHGVRLQQKGITYAPDYIVNSGGLIQVADELYGANKERVLQKTKTIYDTLRQVYAMAEGEGICTAAAADRVVEQRLAMQRARNNFFTKGRTRVIGRTAQR